VVSLRASKLPKGVNSWASERVESMGTSSGRPLNGIWLLLVNCAWAASANRARRLREERKNMVVLLNGPKWATT
jgi:hypothetical protein